MIDDLSTEYRISPVEGSICERRACPPVPGETSSNWSSSLLIWLWETHREPSHIGAGVPPNPSWAVVFVHPVSWMTFWLRSNVHHFVVSCSEPMSKSMPWNFMSFDA